MFARLIHLARCVVQPELPGRKEAIARAWEALPAELRTPDQVAGRTLAGCAATHQIMERCNFSCTACYLANTANATPPLPFEEVLEQLRAIRAHLGPWGNVQLTAGEVTLLPVEELARIVSACQELELSAMLMTHGETFRDDPSYLPKLMEAGLEKVAVHVDTTQRGRRGQRKGDREADLHWIRDEIAARLQEARRRTGRPLAAAHTMTVCEENLDEVPDVLRWVARNADTFRMISFQPAAAVGRTRSSTLAGRERMRARLWDRIERGLGKRLNPRQFIFGHPRCTQVALAFAVRFGERVEIVEVVRERPFDQRFFRHLMHGPFAGFSPDGMKLDEATARLIGRLLRDPSYFVHVPAFAGWRAWRERSWFADFVHAVLRGEPWFVRPLVVVVHHFMSSDELETPEGRERVASCVFRLPVEGRMVSMCELNGSPLRAQLNQRTAARLRGRRPQAVSPSASS